MTAHVGTHEYWVQLALKRATVAPLIDEQNRVLAEIDKAEREQPRAVIYYDPAMHTPESLGCGPGVELVARAPYEIRPVLIDREELELDVLPPEAFDAEPLGVVVWGRLEPTGLQLDGACTRKEVRCPSDLDGQTARMRAFCWPTAVSPYGWPP